MFILSPSDTGSHFSRRNSGVVVERPCARSGNRDPPPAGWSRCQRKGRTCMYRRAEACWYPSHERSTLLWTTPRSESSQVRAKQKCTRRLLSSSARPANFAFSFTPRSATRRTITSGRAGPWTSVRKRQQKEKKRCTGVSGQRSKSPATKQLHRYDSAQGTAAHEFRVVTKTKENSQSGQWHVSSLKAPEQVRNLLRLPGVSGRAAHRSRVVMFTEKSVPFPRSIDTHSCTRFHNIWRFRSTVATINGDVQTPQEQKHADK